MNDDHTDSCDRRRPWTRPWAIAAGVPYPRTAVSDRGCGSRYSYRLYGTDKSEDLPLPPTEYRLMWYTDLLSNHRGTSENTPPHCCSAVLLSQPVTFSLSRLSSLFPCLSPAFPFRFYFSPFLSRSSLLLSLSLSATLFLLLLYNYLVSTK